MNPRAFHAARLSEAAQSRGLAMAAAAQGKGAQASFYKSQGREAVSDAAKVREGNGQQRSRAPAQSRGMER